MSVWVSSSEARSARLPGKPRTTPLWLKIRAPSRNGAQACTETGIPTVADRTAATNAVLRTPVARSRNDASVHIGTAWR